MSTRQHRQGDKFEGRHTTYTQTAAKLVDEAAKRTEVIKIVSGIITGGIDARKERANFKVLDGCVQVEVIGKNDKQLVTIMTNNPEKTMKKLRKLTHRWGK